MPLELYLDVHVPAAIAEGLRRRGTNVLTSQEDGTREASDEVLLARCTELGRVLVSQDRDLLVIAANWQENERPFPGVIFAAQRPALLGRYIDDLHLIAQCCEKDELASHVLYLPLS